VSSRAHTPRLSVIYALCRSPPAPTLAWFVRLHAGTRLCGLVFSCTRCSVSIVEKRKIEACEKFPTGGSKVHRPVRLLTDYRLLALGVEYADRVGTADPLLLLTNEALDRRALHLQAHGRAAAVAINAAAGRSCWCPPNEGGQGDMAGGRCSVQGARPSLPPKHHPNAASQHLTRSVFSGTGRRVQGWRLPGGERRAGGRRRGDSRRSPRAAHLSHRRRSAKEAAAGRRHRSAAFHGLAVGGLEARHGHRAAPRADLAGGKSAALGGFQGALPHGASAAARHSARAALDESDGQQGMPQGKPARRKRVTRSGATRFYIIVSREMCRRRRRRRERHPTVQGERQKKPSRAHTHTRTMRTHTYTQGMPQGKGKVR